MPSSFLKNRSKLAQKLNMISASSATGKKLPNSAGFLYIQPTGGPVVVCGISEPSMVSMTNGNTFPSTSKAQILAAVEADARIRCSELRGRFWLASVALTTVVQLCR